MSPSPWFRILVPVYWLGFLLHHFLIFRLGLRKKAVLPTLVVGNLTVGGSGKTPMVRWLSEQLSQHRNIGILSRGYGRTSKGIVEVLVNSLATETGDEALELKRALPYLPVVVSENRRKGVEWIQKHHPQVQWVLLDDGLQHHLLQPDISICLVSHSAFNQKNKDLLPAGRWRQPFRTRTQFDVLFLTKCPPNMDCPSDWDACFLEEMGPAVDLRTGNQINPEAPGILLTGLADNQSLRLAFPGWEPYTLPDHGHMNTKEIEALERRAAGRYILTTGKDLARLGPAAATLSRLALVPLRLSVLRPSASELTQKIMQHVDRIERSRKLS
jgi:tetraacyldisaccharide 4'-kinase